MASADRLRRELAAARFAAEVARRYGGARVVMTGLGVRSIDFTTSSDPGRYWCRWRDDKEAGAVFLLRGRLHVEDPQPLPGETPAPWVPGYALSPEDRAALERAITEGEARGLGYVGPGEHERQCLEALGEAERRWREAATVHSRALAEAEAQGDLARVPEPAPAPPAAPAPARTGAELAFMDLSAAALPPRRRGRVTSARTEPVQGGGLTGKLTRA